MRTLKRAEQRNVLLDQDYYTQSQIDELLIKKEAWRFRGDAELRLNLEPGSRLEVELDEYGCYHNVLINTDGTKYNVIL